MSNPGPRGHEHMTEHLEPMHGSGPLEAAVEAQAYDDSFFAPLPAPPLHFIQLHGVVSNEPVYVNVFTVTMFNAEHKDEFPDSHPLGYEDYPEHWTSLVLGDGIVLGVTESPADVAAMISGCRISGISQK